MFEHIIQQLLEFQGNDAESLEMDKLLLRIFENPSLMAYLNGVGKQGEKTELDFLDLPQQGIEAVKRLIGPTEIEVLAFESEGRPHVGFRFDLRPLAKMNSEVMASERE
jgi:hypothetical protein